MDFDFLDRRMLEVTREAVVAFRSAVEGAQPSDLEFQALKAGIRSFPHTNVLDSEFTVAAVDGSGEFPVLQQDDIFLHFAIAAGAAYQTASKRQHKLASVSVRTPIQKQFVVLSDEMSKSIDSYAEFLRAATGLELADLASQSDYCQVYSRYGRSLRLTDVAWRKVTMSKASQVASHAYLLRSMAELGMAIRMLETKPRYLLLDTSLVYFLLGEAVFLPELMKRYLITKANAQGTGVVALCKSHNIPNGDLIGRYAKDELGFKDHWYLRLPSAALGEPTPAFLEGREIPPKLSVSYLFKFHATSFPLRIDVDADWWRTQIGGDKAKERQFFGELDFTCHEVRSFGYPYPMHAAHRSASLTKQERRALKDMLVQQAQKEGLLRGSFPTDPEQLHMGGV
jgi:hypothetical protein